MCISIDNKLDNNKTKIIITYLSAIILYKKDINALLTCIT